MVNPEEPSPSNPPIYTAGGLTLSSGAACNAGLALDPISPDAFLSSADFTHSATSSSYAGSSAEVAPTAGSSEMSSSSSLMAAGLEREASQGCWRSME